MDSRGTLTSDTAAYVTHQHGPYGPCDEHQFASILFTSVAYRFWPSIWPILIDWLSASLIGMHIKQPGQPTASLIDWLVFIWGFGEQYHQPKSWVVWKGLSDDDPNWRTDFWELKPPIRSKIGLPWWKGLQTCTLQMFLHATCFNRKLIEKFLWDIKYYKTIFEIYRYIVVSLIPGFSVFLCVGLL